VHIFSGFGELWSAQIFSAYLNSLKMKSSWMDARDILIVEYDRNDIPRIDWEKTSLNFNVLFFFFSYSHYPTRIGRIRI